MTSILDVIKTDLSNAWGEVETEVEGEGKVLWDDFKVVLTAALPAQYAIIRGFVIQVLPSVLSGNVVEIEDAILNLASTQEITWLQQLGSKTLQAFIAIIVASLSNTPASNTTPVTPPVA